MDGVFITGSPEPSESGLTRVPSNRVSQALVGSRWRDGTTSASKPRRDEPGRVGRYSVYMAAAAGTPSGAESTGSDLDRDEVGSEEPAAGAAPVKGDDDVDDEVDEWERESFPASDPPANW